MSDEYECAACGGTFGKGWSEVDAMEEAVNNFGPMLEDQICIVCDDCYQYMVAICPPRRMSCDT